MRGDEVFGEGYASTYDHVYADKDYPSECDLLERLFDEHARRAVRSVLDLGCGTGRHALEFATRGFDVVGVDRSEGMLTHAREAADRHDLDVRWELGDLRSVRLQRSFDAVLMMFAVLGYQLTDEDVDAALDTVRAHLEPGGIFAFDVWYGPAVLAGGLDRREREVVVDNEVWRRTSWGVRRDGRPLVDVTIELEPPDGEPVQETHTVRFFDRHSLERGLNAAGLELVDLLPTDGPPGEPDASTWNVVGVARPTRGPRP